MYLKLMKKNIDVKSSRGVIFILGSSVLIASLIIGGGTDRGTWSTIILQLAGLGLLLLTLNKQIKPGKNNKIFWPIIWLIIPAIYACLQILPLPPYIWTHLPGHSQIVEIFQLVTPQLAWFSVSVVPGATRLSIFSLLPAAAIFVATFAETSSERKLSVYAILIIGIFSSFLGLLQILQGSSSSLRFYAQTNPTEAVGFFANRNHFSAFLYSLILFAFGTFAANLGDGSRTLHQRKQRLVNPVRIVVFATAVIIFGSSQALTGSRMGNILTFLAIIGGFAIAFLHYRSLGGAIRLKYGILVIAILIVGIVLNTGVDKLTSPFENKSLADGRYGYVVTTFRAAMQYLPLGSGLGSFEKVYGIFETKDQLQAGTYVNHAHNDFVELFLETGIFGSLWAAVFLVWWAMKSWAIWRPSKASQSGCNPIDLIWARVGSTIIILILLHSVVDYPLRTDAIACLFAFASALMMPALVSLETQGNELRRTGSPAGRVSHNSSQRLPKSGKGREPTVDSKPGTPPNSPDWPSEWNGR